MTVRRSTARESGRLITGSSLAFFSIARSWRGGVGQTRGRDHARRTDARCPFPSFRRGLRLGGQKGIPYAMQFDDRLVERRGRRALRFGRGGGGPVEAC